MLVRGDSGKSVKTSSVIPFLLTYITIVAGT